MPYLNFLTEEKFLSRSEDLPPHLALYSPTIQKDQHTKITLFYRYIKMKGKKKRMKRYLIIKLSYIAHS